MTDSDLEELLSVLYHALRTERRRNIIRILRSSNDRTLSTSDLAREIAGGEIGVSPEHATGEPYRNAYNALSQTHLPTLSAAGIIIYEPKRQLVSPGVHLDLARLLLDANTSTVDVVSALTAEMDTDDTE
jgi:hypothetical protein